MKKLDAGIGKVDDGACKGLARHLLSMAVHTVLTLCACLIKVNILINHDTVVQEVSVQV